jgi:hypothetical protein
MSVKQVLLQAFSGKDNQTLDIGRVLWAVSVLSFLGMGFFGIYKGEVKDFLAMGTGIAAVLAAGGAAIGLKSKTEPGQNE